MESTQSIIVSLVVILAFVTGMYYAYNEGYLDPFIEKLGCVYFGPISSPPITELRGVYADYPRRVYMFKVKAEAEKKKMEAQGMKAGEDFVDCEA
jgi:hypothetical protein